MINRVPDVPRLLDRLEKAELISRVRDRDDRRHVTARITDKGTQLLDQIRHLSNPVEGWFKRLTPNQLEALIAALDVIREG
jgi:DNA-binding MarR family transcriptional regulator